MSVILQFIFSLSPEKLKLFKQPLSKKIDSEGNVLDLNFRLKFYLHAFLGMKTEYMWADSKQRRKSRLGLLLALPPPFHDYIIVF